MQARETKDDILFLGDGIPLYGGFITESLAGARLAGKDSWFPDVKIVARLGAQKFNRREFEDPDTLAPMYLYSSHCDIKGIEK